MQIDIKNSIQIWSWNGLEPKKKKEKTLERQIQRNTFPSLFTWKSTRQIPNWNYHPNLQHMKSKKFGMWNCPMKSKKVWDVELANIIQNYNIWNLKSLGCEIGQYHPKL
jgi:hypothetical protein